jgi:hypothetical protein
MDPMPITLHTENVKELPEQDELVAGRERDEFQRQIDKDVHDLKVSTAKAGWPDPDPKRLFHRYVVGADDKAAFKAVLRRAGVLHRVDLVWYKDAKTEAGHIVIKFHVTRKVDKDGKPVADEELNADGSLKPDTKTNVSALPKPGTK